VNKYAKLSSRSTGNSFLLGGVMAFKSILDPEFKYRNAASTDVRKTFERIRREQRLEEERRRAANDFGSAKVIARIEHRQRLPGG
jgi:hypothetical protein